MLFRGDRQFVHVVVGLCVCIKIDENVVIPDGSNEGVHSNQSLVVASAFEGTYPGLSICAAMPMRAQYSGRVSKTTAPYKSGVPLLPSVIFPESRRATIPRDIDIVLPAYCARNT